MGSNGKKKTTMAKLTRESKLREKRIDKQAKKDARKRAAADPSAQVAELEPGEAFDGDEGHEGLPVDGTGEESRERGSNP